MERWMRKFAGTPARWRSSARHVHRIRFSGRGLFLRTDRSHKIAIVSLSYTDRFSWLHRSPESATKHPRLKSFRQFNVDVHDITGHCCSRTKPPPTSTVPCSRIHPAARTRTLSVSWPTDSVVLPRLLLAANEWRMPCSAAVFVTNWTEQRGHQRIVSGSLARPGSRRIA